MVSDSLSPRMAATVGLFALAPVAWYGFASSWTAGVFSAINVAIIIVAMVIATSPTEGPDHHDGASA